MLPPTSGPLSTKIPKYIHFSTERRSERYSLCLLLHADLHNLLKHKGAVNQGDFDGNTIKKHARGKESSSNMANTTEARICSLGLTSGAEGRSPSPLSAFDGDTPALTEGDLEHYCCSLPPVLGLSQVCAQSDGGEVLEGLRSWRNCSLGDASQSFSLKRCHDILGTLWSLLLAERVLVFCRDGARTVSPTASCVHEGEVLQIRLFGAGSLCKGSELLTHALSYLNAGLLKLRSFRLLW